MAGDRAPPHPPPPQDHLLRVWFLRSGFGPRQESSLLNTQVALKQGMQGLQFENHHAPLYWSCWPVPPGTEPHPHLGSWRPVMPFGWAAVGPGAGSLLLSVRSGSSIPPEMRRAFPLRAPSQGPSRRAPLPVTPLSPCPAAQAVSGPVSVIWRGLL